MRKYVYVYVYDHWFCNTVTFIYILCIASEYYDSARIKLLHLPVYVYMYVLPTLVSSQCHLYVFLLERAGLVSIIGSNIICKSKVK